MRARGRHRQTQADTGRQARQAGKREGRWLAYRAGDLHPEDRGDPVVRVDDWEHERADDSAHLTAAC